MRKLCKKKKKNTDNFENRTIPMGKCLFLWVDVRLMNYFQSERSLKLLKRLVINKINRDKRGGTLETALGGRDESRKWNKEKKNI